MIKFAFGFFIGISTFTLLEMFSDKKYDLCAWGYLAGTSSEILKIDYEEGLKNSCGFYK